jgi:hypothetical protein
MRRPRFRGLGVLALFLVALSAPSGVIAQQATVPQEQLAAYAKAFEAIGKLRDEFHASAAAAQNKKPEAQHSLQEKLRQDILAALQQNGLSEQQYNHITWVVSTDAASRAALDKLLGIAPPPPPPAASPAAAATAQTTATGDQQAGNPHIAHVMTSFARAPDAMGLLPAALAEAQVVIQHAGLAARNTSDLDAMKLHARHIAHAIEPAEGATGPGKGYGLKKAATDVAAHIELAAKANGASQNIVTHSVHIATAARNTAARADEILKLTQQIQTATAADAAELVARLNTLAGQLIAGADSNGDGRIGWQEGEGGLQHVEQHLKLMMDAEKGY